MSTLSPDQAVGVLGHYPALRDSGLVSLGHCGGFSGARLWRVETAAGAFCLRAWPTDGPPAEILRAIHHRMRAATDAGLEFVPCVLTNAAGTTVTLHADRQWEVTSWMPGRADFHERPTPVRLAAACVALARLHRTWASPGTSLCPAIRRRLERYRDWLALLGSGWRPRWDAAPADAVRPWAERAWKALSVHIPAVPALLAAWLDRPVAVQPCLCDIWHDHVLFEKDVVTGLIDYGAAKIDHVAVDLARLLGSLAEEDGPLRAAGLSAYRRVRPFSLEEEALVTVLDRTGTLLGTANWLRWLYHEGRRFEDRAGVARRLAALVTRIERWGQV